MDKIAVPQPTSRTTLSLNRCLLLTIELIYDRVRTSSFYAEGRAESQRHARPSSYMHHQRGERPDLAAEASAGTPKAQGL